MSNIININNTEKNVLHIYETNGRKLDLDVYHSASRTRFGAVIIALNIFIHIISVYCFIIK